MGARDRKLKPCIVVDTRERVPWGFDHERVDVVMDTLSTGDYSLRHHEGEVAIERKSLDDYIQTILRERPRFERELERMRVYPLRAIIVEACWADVRDHNYTSLAHPSSIFGLTCCLQVDYAVPIMFCHDRAIAARVCERLIRRWAENLEKNAEEAMKHE